MKGPGFPAQHVASSVDLRSEKNISLRRVPAVPEILFLRYQQRAVREEKEEKGCVTQYILWKSYINQ